MRSHFNRFTLILTKAQALGASNQGQCDNAVRALSEVPSVARQLRLLRPEDVRAELAECGAWNAEELEDAAQNLRRILWIASMNIRDEIDTRQAYRFGF